MRNPLPQLEYNLRTIVDFWHIVRSIDDAIPARPSDCLPYTIAHVEKLLLARSWRFLCTEVSTFDHSILALRQQHAREGAQMPAPEAVCLTASTSRDWWPTPSRFTTCLQHSSLRRTIIDYSI